MSTNEQNGVIGSLCVEKRDLQREKAALTVELDKFATKLRELADKVSSDKYHALGLTKDLNVSRLSELLGDFAHVDTALMKCNRSLSELGM